MPGTPPFRGFLLDADNTIFDYDRAERDALDGVLAEAGVAASDALRAAYRRINDGLWRAFEQGAVTQEALKVERFRRLFAEAAPGARADPAAVSRRYLELLGRQAHLLPHAAAALADLAQRAALALVTNGISEVQRPRLARSGLGPLFSVVVISGEVGFAKPDPRLFRVAAEGLGLAGDEVLCVGDVPGTDIRGARAAGMAACWVAAPGASWPPGEPGPDYTIADLRGLAALAPPWRSPPPRFP
jgi:YjjG family noncanonical pyrimidine nucleotidase